MKSIEIKDGVKIGFEEFLQGASKLDSKGLEELTQKLTQLLLGKRIPRRSEREMELIKIIYTPLPEKTQKQLDSLTSKAERTEREQKEFLQLSETVQDHHFAWLEALGELAQIRGISIEAVKKQIGLPPNPPVYES